MGTWQVFRAGAMLLAATLVCGCFAATTPLIPAGGGEDVGDVLRYQVFFVSPDAPDRGVALEFRRVSGPNYKMYFSSPDGTSQAYEDGRGKTLIRRAGDRDGAPIFLVQVDMEREFEEAFVALRADGMGVQALFDCRDTATADLARKYGMILSCHDDLTKPYFGFLQVLPGKSADAVGFFADARAAGLVVWEDDRGISIAEVLSQLLG